MSDGNKIVVEFDSAFWSDDYGVFLLAARTAEDRGCLQTWLNLHKLLVKPVLMGLLLGNAARHMESLSQEEVEVMGKELLFTECNRHPPVKCGFVPAKSDPPPHHTHTAHSDPKTPIPWCNDVV